MPHSHDHAPRDYGRAFAVGVVLNVAYVAVEAGYGLATGSLALLSDAGHNLSDVFGLLLAWGGHALAKIPPSRRRTYGWRGTTVLAALANALLLVAAVGAIAWEALNRFSAPTPIGGLPIIVVAAIGVLINTLTALLFWSGRKHDLNIRGAFLHMAADAGVSIGVVVAGLAIYATGWTWVDPATSLAIATIIFISTWGLLKESANLAIQGAPGGIDPEAVQRCLAALEGVDEVHDLHIWAMSTQESALTAHLVKPRVEDDDALLRHAREQLHAQFGIDHTTIQIERNGSNCGQRQPTTI